VSEYLARLYAVRVGSVNPMSEELGSLTSGTKVASINVKWSEKMEYLLGEE